MSRGASAQQEVDEVSTMQVCTDLSETAHDRAMTMKIMKKRQEEMARRNRLMDPRKRQFGVEHAVLDVQVREKREAIEAEAMEDALYAQHLAGQEAVLQTVEMMKQAQQRQKQIDTINFSMDNLHMEQRREYHLSDPKQYTSSFLTAPREELGPSSMSKFQGEAVDLEKKKAMQEETKQWLRQQMAEKNAREQAEKDWDRTQDAKMLMANNLRGICEEAELQEQKSDKHAEVMDNQRIAAQVAERKRVRAQREHDETVQHRDNLMTDPRMNEAHDNTLSAYGKKLDQKRLTLEEEQDVYNTNAHQIRQKRLMQQREKDEDAEHHRLNMMGVEVRGALEHRQRGDQKERNRSTIAENQAMADAKREADIKERRAHKSFDYEQ